VNPIGIVVEPGEQIGIRIKSAGNEEPKDIIEHTATGHLARVGGSRVSVQHNIKQPSHLLLPVTRGNVIGTFISGGKLPPLITPSQIN
jgi:hypothetical protein